MNPQRKPEKAHWNFETVYPKTDTYQNGVQMAKNSIEYESKFEFHNRLPKIIFEKSNLTFNKTLFIYAVYASQLGTRA